jgi:formylglycine-generating enzyme required for sulfatase activity
MTWENSIGVQFQLIPPARYLQGITEEERARLDVTEDEMPQHDVVLTSPWYCGTLPITLGQFQKVCRFDPSTSEMAVASIQTTFQCREVLCRIEY